MLSTRVPEIKETFEILKVVRRDEKERIIELEQRKAINDKI